MSVFSESMASDMDMFAPNTTTVIDDFKVEEFPSADLGILPGFQAGSDWTSMAGGVAESGSGEIIEGNVVRHDLLVCQPCDEDEEVIAVGKTNSRGVEVMGVNGQVTAGLYEYDEEEIDERPYMCKQRGCKYRAKERSSIKQHLADVHDIGVTWHPCPQEGCEYKAKKRSTLKLHLAGIHDIGVTWHPCPQEGCTFKAKQRSNLKRHIAKHHV
jgi:hypothetical protein